MTQLATPPVVKPSWTRPYVELGMAVLFYQSGTRTGAPMLGIVSQVNERHLCINCIVPNTYNMLVRDGVLHVDDPKANKHDLSDSGAWEHTPWMTKLLDLVTPEKKD